MKEIRVLFLGNSHTFFHDMPQIFKQLCEMSTYHAEVSMQAHPGVTFGWHLNQMSELRFAFLHGGYDYVILQQAAHIPCPSKEETVRDGSELIRLARECGITPIVTIPWAEKHIPEHQAVMYDVYSTLASETGVDVTPVGQIFERLKAEHPEINLYWIDGEHSSPYGAYAIASAVYARIFQKSPQGLPNHGFETYAGTAQEMAQMKGAIATAKESPDKPQLLEAAMAEYKKHFYAPWDKEQLRRELDPALCQIIQTVVWEEVSKIL